MTAEDLEDLREEWSTLYRKALPSLARAKDPAQSRWPVTLDHCFARIILDNTIGRSAKQDGQYERWDSVITKPAVRNMTEEQLNAAIALGHEIEQGQADLQRLDEISLNARGKNEAKYGKKRQAEDISEKLKVAPPKRSRSAGQQTTLTFDHPNHASTNGSIKERSSLEEELETTSAPNIDKSLDRIRAHTKLTDYRKRLYATLLTVPIGQYTTYQAMADFLDSSARAVGSGMRNNPFAPDVPCHRVLASDRSIGGFGGSWGKDGKNADKKVQLLKAEGVKFDSTGKAKGPIFKDFKRLPI